jgi:hypothetical protein
VADEKKPVHAARVQTGKGGRVWVLFDEEHTLRGKAGEGRKSLLSRWREVHGKVDLLVRIQGVCRPSELATQVADLQRRRKTTLRTCSWCHEPGDVTAGPAHCKKCGHRADLSRLECDCPQCRPASAENLPRTRACLAACLGIPTAALEAGVLAELLAACGRALEFLNEHPGGPALPTATALNRALAKARGE